MIAASPARDGLDVPDGIVLEYQHGGLLRNGQAGNEAVLKMCGDEGRGWFMRERSGSPSRTRTYDQPVNSRLLYQLSYRGMCDGNPVAEPAGRSLAL